MAALVYADRVQETSTTTGTGTLDLAGATTAFRGFVVGIGDGNECCYLIEDADGASWEVGIGTVTDAATDTLSRDTILANDNGDTSAITLSSGTHTISCVAPADFFSRHELKIDTTYNSASDHADITAEAGKFYLINLSAVTTNDLNFTLPVAANVNTGERVGFYITATNASFELQIKTGAASDLLNGVDGSSGLGQQKAWQVGEYIVYDCYDGSTADWMTSIDGRIECAAEIQDQGGTSISASTFTVVPHDTELYDVGGIASASNDSSSNITVRRDGKYEITMYAAMSMADTDVIQCSVKLNGSGADPLNDFARFRGVAAATGLVSAGFRFVADLTDGDVLKHIVWSDTSSPTLESVGAWRPRFQVAERLER